MRHCTKYKIAARQEWSNLLIHLALSVPDRACTYTDTCPWVLPFSNLKGKRPCPHATFYHKQNFKFTWMKAASKLVASKQ